MPGSGPRMDLRTKGPMWMMQQLELPASPRAVAIVPKAVRSSRGLSSARHYRKGRRDCPVFPGFLSSVKEKSVARTRTKLTLADVTVARTCTKLTLADVTVARTCTMPEKVQLCGREWCPKTDPPAPCASNPEARLKYLKYPSPHSLSGLGESEVHDPNTNLRYSPPAFVENASCAHASTETEPRPEA